MIILFLFLCYWLGLSLRYSWIVFLLVSLLFLFFIWKRCGKKILILSILILLVGLGNSFIRFDYQKSTYAGFVYESKDNYFLLLSSGEKLYCYQKEHPYEIGDYLQVKGNKGSLEFSNIESSFDSQAYLSHKGVNYRLYPTQINRSFANPLHLKAYRKWFLNHFTEEGESLVNAILFSNQDDGETVGILKDLHLVRLISNSGIYLYAFLSFFEFLLSYKLKKKWTKLSSLVLLLLYSLFTFPRFTSIRIAIFLIVRWINEFVFKKKLTNFQIIGCVGLLCLLLDKYLAYQDSFILGFSLPLLISLLNTYTSRFKSWKQKAINLVFITLFFIPFELRYYHSLSLLSVPLQLLLTPAFIVFALSALICFCGPPLYSVVNFFASIIGKIVSPLSFLKLEIYASSFSPFVTLIYYLLFGAFIYYLSIGFKPVYRKIIYALISLFLLSFIPMKNVLSDQVSFINVGQDDSCLIRHQNQTILIDTGGSIYNDIAVNCLIPYFKKQQIYQIDYVITTHDDYDHSGALPSLVEHFRVGTYLSQVDDFPLKYAGTTLYNYNHYFSDASEENDKSLVFGFHFMDTDFLVMGDAPKTIEKMMINEYASIPCDILKVGHHGSETSTSDAFIKYLQPKEAIISVGYNHYGHPSANVLKILQKNGVKIHRTDKEGTITYFNYIFM